MNQIMIITYRTRDPISHPFSRKDFCNAGFRASDRTLYHFRLSASLGSQLLSERFLHIPGVHLPAAYNIAVSAFFIASGKYAAKSVMFLAELVDKISLHNIVHIPDKQKDILLIFGDRLKAKKRRFIFQVTVFLLQLANFVKQMLYSVSDLILASVCQMGDFFNALLSLLHQCESSPSAGDKQAHSAVKAQRLHYFDQADLACHSDMGRTACADIYLRDRDQPHLSFDLDLASVTDLSKLFTVRIRNLYRKISVNDLISFPFQKKDLFFTELSVDVQRHRIVAEVKSDIIKSIPVVHKPGQNMLAGVILHEAEPSLPVDLKKNLFAGQEKPAIVFRAADSMSDHSVFDLYIRYSQHSGSVTAVVSGAADPADVAGLAPAFREKDRLVQEYNKLQQDIVTYENNIGFFSASKNSEPLIKQMQERIEAAKQELKELEAKIIKEREGEEEK